MSKIAQSYNKRTGWRRLYDWEFGKFAEFTDSPAETGIASATYTLRGDLDNDITIVSQAISGTRVQLLLDGGTPGTTYTITVTAVTTPSSYKIDWDGILVVTY